MRTTSISCILWMTALLLPTLGGCGGKQDSASTTAPANETPGQAMQRHLNDPNVSAQEKEMIRKNMSSGAATGAAPGSAGGTSSSGQ